MKAYVIHIRACVIRYMKKYMITLSLEHNMLFRYSYIPQEFYSMNFVYLIMYKLCK